MVVSCGGGVNKLLSTQFSQDRLLLLATSIPARATQPQHLCRLPTADRLGSTVSHGARQARDGSVEYGWAWEACWGKQEKQTEIHTQGSLLV